MKVSTKRRPFRLCALVVLSLGLLIPVGSASATAAGRVVAWGCPAFADGGQCAVPASASNGVTAISAGNFHSLALKDDGSVLAWGCAPWADFGQCGVPPSASSGVTAVSAGFVHSLALKRDGSVIAWGCGVGGGTGECAVPTSALSGVTAISAGDNFSLALKQDLSVVAWGCVGLPAEVCTVPPAALSAVTAISAGAHHSLALKQDGSVVAWGCPPGSDSGQCNVPAAASSGVIAIAAGDWHSLALKQDGRVVAWGCTTFDTGQCVVPAEAASGVTAISAAFSYSLALRDGGALVWGCVNFDFGQCTVPPQATSGVTAISAADWHSLAIVPPNHSPICTSVTATPSTLAQMRDKMVLITLSGATDPDGDTLSYQIYGVTQDEYVTGVGDDTFPDAALTSGGAGSNQVLVRSEANPQFNGRVYRIAYRVSDGQGGSCSGTAGSSGTTTAKVGVPRKKGTPAIDNGATTSWNSFTGVPTT